VTVVVTVAVMLCGSMPFRDLIRPSRYQPAPRADAAREVVDMIPDEATVESDVGLLNRVTSCCRVYFMGRVGDAPPPDYMLFDLPGGGWSGFGDGDVEGWVGSAHPGVAYTRVIGREGYVLLRRESG
jgi:hypothetical protein